MPNTITKSARTSSDRSGAKSKESMLSELFTDALKDIYWAEKHLTKVLPKLQNAASSEELKQAFGDHLAATKEHVSRLEEVFETLGRTARGKKCEAMEGLSKEGESIIEETEDGSATRDAGLIMAAQKVEHYEIATYGSLVQLSKVLGYSEATDLLEQTLQEEKEADTLLTSIAEKNVNSDAASEGK